MQIFVTTLIIGVMVFGVVWIIIAPEIIQEPIPEKYIDHVPILIKNDQNFTDYGFPGNGTAENPFLIERLYINSSFDGIRIKETTKFFEIRNCLLNAFRYGIFISDAESRTLNIVNNIFLNGCMYVLRCDFTTIESNVLNEDNFAGIFITRCDHSILTNNTVEHHGFGIQALDSSYCTITNNTVYSEFYQEINVGIAIHGSGSIIANNTVSNQYWGIYLTNTYTTITNNFIDACRFGIYAQSAGNSIISNNTIVNCDYEGIYISRTSYLNCYFNHFEGNNISIELYESSFIDVSNNSFYYNNIGVDLHDGMLGTISYLNTHNNTVKYNLFLNNTSYGVRIRYRCRYSKIYLNSFYNNNPYGTSQAFDEGFYSSWYYFGTTGNYWNEWLAGEYIIDGNGNYTDAYPLVEPPV
ncbi:MAG: hypothetical protein GPJ51_01875 [Candidatus Heimdallarchaeota archaeon]|nr:hypothetical protein [Candidatus Heimdallarchaeota archaeon]